MKKILFLFAICFMAVGYEKEATYQSITDLYLLEK